MGPLRRNGLGCRTPDPRGPAPGSRKRLNAPSETRDKHHGRLAGQEHVFPAILASRGLVHLLSPHVTLNQELTLWGSSVPSQPILARGCYHNPDGCLALPRRSLVISGEQRVIPWFSALERSRERHHIELTDIYQ